MTVMAESDAAGRFSFVALPPGRFVIEATRDGFLPASYGQKKPGKAGTPIELAGSERLEVTLPMTRGSAITGTVVDDAGDPLVRADVRLLSMVTNQNGVRRMRVVARVRTDDRGVYRFFQLAPDTYLVSATPVDEDIDVDTDAAAERVVNATGFAPTYYPMSTTAAHAATVTVDGLNESAGVDIRVSPVRTVTIRGTVAGLPAVGVPVQVLLHTTEPGEEPTSLTATVNPNGEFTLPNVAPGQYTVYAQTLPGAPSDRAVVFDGSMQTTIPAARVAAFDRWHGRTAITVDGQNTTPVIVLLRPGRSISGRVVRDLAKPPTGPAARAVTRISITPSPVPAGLPAFNTSPQVDVDADGAFVLPGIRPGRYFLRASGPGTVRSVMWNGVETLDFPLEVTADSDVVDVVMTLTDKLSELSGMVTDAAGRPVYEATVLAVAADSRYWTLGTRRIVTAQPAADGRYAFRGLPPGEYRLAVVTEFEVENRLDPAYLQQISPVSTSVTLTEGGSVRQDLRLR
jgi:protocatechuate 3,4-dioxygenase beta subunit/sarcosine oxidase gamma subunit